MLSHLQPDNVYLQQPAVAGIARGGTMLSGGTRFYHFRLYVVAKCHSQSEFETRSQITLIDLRFNHLSGQIHWENLTKGNKQVQHPALGKNRS